MTDAQAITSHVSQIKEDGICAALQAVFYKASVALKPSNNKGSATKQPAAAPPLNKKALAQGIIVLINHAGTLSLNNPTLRQEILSKVGSALRQQPWLWDLFVRRHLSDLLHHPQAAALLVNALSWLDATTEARALCTLTSTLRNPTTNTVNKNSSNTQDMMMVVGVPSTPASYSALAAAQDAALAHVRRCISIVSHDVAGFMNTTTTTIVATCGAVGGITTTTTTGVAAGLTAAGVANNPPAVVSTGQVRITPTPQLPAALQLLLWLGCRDDGGGGGNGSIGGSAMASGVEQSASASCIGGNGIGGGIGVGGDINRYPSTTYNNNHSAMYNQQQKQENKYVLQGQAIEAGISYAVLLIEQLSTAQGVYNIINTTTANTTTTTNPLSSEQTAAGVVGPLQRLDEAQALTIRCIQELISVLVEALLSLPAVAAAVASKLHSGVGGTGNNPLPPPFTTTNTPILGGGGGGQSVVEEVARSEMITTIACMLSLRWELAQYLAAAGPEMKFHSKGYHAPWLPSTCIRLLDLAVNRTTTTTTVSRSGAQTTLLMPPAVLSHALELVTTSLKAATASSGGGGSGNRTSSIAAGGSKSVVSNNSTGTVINEASTSSLVNITTTTTTNNNNNSIGSSQSMLLKGVADRAASFYSACFTGLTHPHAVLQGGAHREAMATATTLRTLLTAPPASSLHTLDGGGNANNNNNQRHGGGSGSGVKRERAKGGGGGGGSAAKRERKDVVVDPQGAVDELLRLLEQPAAAAAAADGGGNNNTNTNTNNVYQTPNISEAPSVEQQPTPATTTNTKQAARKRITPQAIVTTTTTAPQQQQQQRDEAGTSSRPPTDPKQRKRITPVAISPANETINHDPQQQQQQQLHGGDEQQEEEDNDVGGGGSGGINGGSSKKDGSWCVGRVLMMSTTNMDDAAKEALWSAYIEDKERLVEMLGDSDYQRWYDEEAHPMRQPTRAGGDVDAAFDAVFGTANTSPGSFSGPSLPQTILETSAAQPWQAALAASLQLATQALKNEGPEELSTQEERAVAAATALKVLDPNHSRNTWLGASKAARTDVVSGCILRYAVGLHAFLLRASRRTSPVILAAYSELMTALLATSSTTTTALSTTTSRPGGVNTNSTTKPHLNPLKFASGLIQAVCHCPPLLPVTLTPTSTTALIRLSTAGLPPEDQLPYTTSLLWLLLHPAAHRGTALWPQWLRTGCPQAATHPVIKADAKCVAAAVVELLKCTTHSFITSTATLSTLSISGNGTNGSNNNDSTTTDMDEEEESVVLMQLLLPLMDACQAALFKLQGESEVAEEAERVKRLAEMNEEADANVKKKPQTSAAAVTKDTKTNNNASAIIEQPVRILGTEAVFELSQLAIALCTALSKVSQRFACMLEPSSTATNTTNNNTTNNNSTAPSSRPPSIATIENTAATVALSLEYTDSLTPLLTTTPSITMLPPQHSQRLQTSVDSLEAAQQTCLELLRSLPEESPLYVAAVRGMDSAPSLVGAEGSGSGCGGSQEGAAGGDGDHKMHDQQQQEGDDDGGGNGRSTISRAKRLKRLREIRNPYLRAIVAEGRGGRGDVSDGDLSDLEDFIVTRPDRDYGAFISEHFPMPGECSDEEEEEEETGEEEEEDVDDGVEGGDADV